MTSGHDAPVGRHGSVTSWPPGADELLVRLVKDGFTTVVVGHRDDPELLAAYYQWGRETDSVYVCHPHDALAVRTTHSGGRSGVLWAYRGGFLDALRGLLDLPHPQHPDAPSTVIDAAEAPRIPHLGRPMTLRVPTNHRRGARARRLAADEAGASGRDGAASPNTAPDSPGTGGGPPRSAERGEDPSAAAG